jgi:branched-chain amino acid transport system substrate-binding protein
MKKTALRILGLCTLASVLSLTACGRKSTDSDVIKIGAILPLTGAVASHGTEMKRGIEMVFAENKNVQIIYEDDESSSKGAVAAANKLISSDKVIAILGPATSSSALSIAPICQQKGVVLYTPTGSSPKIAQAGDYVFSSGPMSKDQAERMADYAFNSLKFRQIAVLYMQDETGTGYLSEFKKAFLKLGGEIVFEGGYERDSKDFKAVLTKLQAGGINAVYCPAIPVTMGLIARQAGEIGYTPVFLSNYGIEDSELIKIAGPSAENILFTAMPISKEFSDDYRRRYNSVPGIGAALSYDAASVVNGIIKNGAGTSDAVRIALSRVRNYSGVCGNLSFDESGEGRRNVIIKTVHNGGFTMKE